MFGSAFGIASVACFRNKVFDLECKLGGTVSFSCKERGPIKAYLTVEELKIMRDDIERAIMFQEKGVIFK